ncbi:hypothetical protein ACFVY1_39705 [Streptomyces sp. NPDC058293]|uniref:hypothetical protein n=1 Tax=Streptomyces sp. NPDC058293 TaxID=3346429 RepID=UPI0036E5EEB5
MQRLLGLFWTHVNPYGRFELDMTSQLDLAGAAAMLPGPRTAPDTQAPEPAAEASTPPAAPSRSTTGG